MARNELAAETRAKGERKGNPFVNYLRGALPAAGCMILGCVLVATAEPSQASYGLHGENPPAREDASPPGKAQADGAEPQQAEQIAKGDLAGPNDAEPGLSWLGALGAFFLRHHVIQTVWKELGFAMIISSLTWLVFDLTLRSRAEDENERRLDEIARNVLHAVLGQRIGRELVEEIEQVNFRVNFVRSLMMANYTVRDAVYEASDGVSVPYVELQSSVTFVVQNVTMGLCKFKVATSLPDPMHPKLRAITGVKTMTAKRGNTEQEEKLDLIKAEKDFREAMSGDPKAQVPFVGGQVELAANETLFVTIVSILAKEEEDSEFLEMGYPTERLSVTVNDHADGAARQIRARTVHRQPKSAASDRGQLALHVEYWTLPQQGVYFWWKRKNATADGTRRSSGVRSTAGVTARGTEGLANSLQTNKRATAGSSTRSSGRKVVAKPKATGPAG